MEKTLCGLSCLTSKVDKLDVDKVVLASVDLCKLSGVVKNGVVETTGYYNRLKGSKILRLLIPAI